MYYLHRYFCLYPSTEVLESDPLQRALLLQSILSLTFKVRFQDYVLEYLNIAEFLSYFNVELPVEKVTPPALVKGATNP